MHRTCAITENVVVLHPCVRALPIRFFRAEPYIAVRARKYIALLRFTPLGKQRVLIALRICVADLSAVCDLSRMVAEIFLRVEQVERLACDQHADHPVFLCGGALTLRLGEAASGQQQRRDQQKYCKKSFIHRRLPPIVRQISKCRPRRIRESSRCG